MIYFHVLFEVLKLFLNSLVAQFDHFSELFQINFPFFGVFQLEGSEKAEPIVGDLGRISSCELNEGGEP